ncbi:glutaredoxin family protein [Candidatus Saccharibacteria bacterium]|nr:glutaredoxin family protein [Candidatus Saccharibacteria bacterium]
MSIEDNYIIKVYTTPTCAYCHALMEWLDSKGISYQECDATKEPGISAVPVTEINGERIVGFDRPGIKRALKDAGLWQ